MPDKMWLASIIEESIVDGPGVRFVLFTQGCPHRCRGCHNPSTYLSVGGKAFSVSRLLSLYDQHPACRGLTLSGGEPFQQPAPLAGLARAVRQRGGDIVTYTGYYLERLQSMAADEPAIQELLSATDLLIDGPFVLARRSLELPFVGSSNQRLIALSERGNRLLDEIPVPETAEAVVRRSFIRRV